MHKWGRFILHQESLLQFSDKSKLQATINEKWSILVFLERARVPDGCTQKRSRTDGNEPPAYKWGCDVTQNFTLTHNDVPATHSISVPTLCHALSLSLFRHQNSSLAIISRFTTNYFPVTIFLYSILPSLHSLFSFFLPFDSPSFHSEKLT